MSESQPPQFTGDDGQPKQEQVPVKFRFRSSPMPSVKVVKTAEADDNDSPSTGRTPSPLGYQPTGNPENRKLVSLDYRLTTLTDLSWQP